MKKTGYMDEGNITLLAKGVELKGEIKVEGTVRIDGRLEGDVQTKGEVIVGEDGVVKGTISAGSLISSGRIKATVTATERVQLLKTATLIGEVHCPVMVMEEGSKFQGLSDMGATAWPEEAPRLPGNIRDGSQHRGRSMALIAKEPDL
ncbi:MAG: polymer-forming cytoskeletal protein [Nitrospira sp.]|nr:polymer-forming cytoskeletal protein [Nitrospira sp.]MBH0183416.1 polymer-forming cytoskeletal protein [Nitrospira sp.]MBH0187240.1 polymer-forming cytoskeletal protein [Nitrospira sp.]MBH0190009.1 polymer-forming cytoskeletal protein [Nitrospira sp.]MBH0197457.1 polymer-forming cytoskeletal protein [Nitrospira sp.]